MKTITIDPTIYRDAEQYAKKHNLNIAHMVEEYFKKLINNDRVESEQDTADKLYISPKIRSLMVGFKCDESMPYDYKKDMQQSKAEKYV